MKANRLTTLAMITLLVLAAVLTAQWRLRAVVFWVIAVVGVTGYVRFSIRRSLRIILSLSAALLVMGLPRAITGESLTATQMVEMAPYYFLSLMVASLFVRREPRRPLPSVLVLYAVMVLISLAGMGYQQSIDVTFGACSVALAVVIALFFATGRTVVRTGRSKATSHHLVAAITLAVTVVGAAALSSGASAYQNRLLGALQQWARLFRRRSTPGFGEQAQLHDLWNVKYRDREQVALRVESDTEPGYLGGRSFISFGGRAWTAAPIAQEVLWPAGSSIAGIEPQPSPWHLFVLDAPGSGPWRGMTIHPAGMYTRVLLSPRGTSVFQAPIDRVQVDACDGVALHRARSAMSYRAFVPSKRRQKLPADLEELCLTVPAQLDPRVRAVAAALFPEPGGVSADRAIARVEHYFRTRYQYQLGIQVPPEEDPLGYFLSEERPAAHCEYFATAAALLLRLNKVPTRYVTGFVASERNDAGGYWIARNADAHAWVEAWDSSRQQWVLVEATPASGVPHPTGARSWQWLDMLRFQLTRLNMLIRSEGIWGLFRWLIDILDSVLAKIFTLGGMVTIAALGSSISLVYFAIRRRRRIRRVHSYGPRTPMQRLLRKTDRRVRRATRLQRRDDETVLQFAHRLWEQAPDHPMTPPAAQWYRRYAEVRYRANGNHNPDRHELSASLPER